MSDPYVGEVRMFGGNFAPVGWFLCNGQLLSIAQYETLFVLIGTTYGGDGATTFALPNLQGRLPVHQGTSGGLTYVMGQAGGTESVTLLTQQLPSHTHTAVTAATATSSSPSGAVLAPPNSTQAGVKPYNNTATPTVALNAQSVTPAGSSQPHGNMQPYLCINFIIAHQGIFPSRN